MEAGMQAKLVAGMETGRKLRWELVIWVLLGPSSGLLFKSKCGPCRTRTFFSKQLRRRQDRVIFKKKRGRSGLVSTIFFQDPTGNLK